MASLSPRARTSGRERIHRRGRSKYRKWIWPHRLFHYVASEQRHRAVPMLSGYGELCGGAQRCRDDVAIVHHRGPVRTCRWGFRVTSDPEHETVLNFVPQQEGRYGIAKFGHCSRLAQFHAGNLLDVADCCSADTRQRAPFIPSALFSAPWGAGVIDDHDHGIEIIVRQSSYAMAPGPTRRACGEAFVEYVTEKLGGKPTAIIVPECGHNNRCIFATDVAFPTVVSYVAA